MAQAKQRVSVRLHRPGHIDEEHDPAGPGPRTAMTQWAGLPGPPQLFAQRAPWVDLTTT
jgi:hypothetical protein